MFGLCCSTNYQVFDLKSVSVVCDIANLLVTCTSELVYENKTDNDSESSFSFPMHGGCVVYHMEAVINNKSIIGICRELQEAKNMYKAAVESGITASYIERNESMQDVFRCHIGKFPKNSEAKIKLKFAMELRLCLGQMENSLVDCFSLSLPLILRPRYTPTEYVGDTNVYQVQNNYDYSFKAQLYGSKVIRDVTCTNYQINTVFMNKDHTAAKVDLLSKFHGEHDLDININYSEMKVPSVLYELGTFSKKCSGAESNSAFLKLDVAMVNFLPKFSKDSVQSMKLEIVFIVDRSGSMDGPNITKAKECLLLFLRSLPTDCKFQIYGFGSHFDKAFNSPQLYSEESINIALNYQKNMNADFGGTELLQPLNDMYSSEVPSDYIRVAFILTDGDVSNQDEVISLVRKHRQKTRVFTVGIGDGFSTSLIEKVAEAGNGKPAAARDSSSLRGTVMELLDLGLNCSQFTDGKFKFKCPPGVSVATVPQNSISVFSNYFATAFCLIDGLKEGETIVCELNGKINRKDVSYIMEINNKNAVSDNEYRVHRLLAKYKIDEMTNEMKDHENDDLKKSLIDLSIEASIVSNYTTFVAVDPDIPTKALCTMDASENLYMDDYDCVDAGIDMEEECSWEGACVEMCGDCDYFVGKSFCETSRTFKDDFDFVDIVLYIAENQSICGSWILNNELISKMCLEETQVKAQKPEGISDDIWMTALVCHYLSTQLADKEKEWKLFVRKAWIWIEKTIGNPVIFERTVKESKSFME